MTAARRDLCSEQGGILRKAPSSGLRKEVPAGKGVSAILAEKTLARAAGGAIKAGMMKNTPFPLGRKEARLLFMDAEFQVREKGDFVRCAVTGRPIPLDELKYWSVERQEAYASPEAALQRHRELLEKNRESQGSP